MEATYRARKAEREDQATLTHRAPSYLRPGVRGSCPKCSKTVRGSDFVATARGSVHLACWNGATARERRSFR